MKQRVTAGMLSLLVTTAGIWTSMNQVLATEIIPELENPTEISNISEIENETGTEDLALEDAEMDKEDFMSEAVGADDESLSMEASDTATESEPEYNDDYDDNIYMEPEENEAGVTLDFAHDVTSLSEYNMGLVNASISSYRSPYITEVKNQEPYGNCWAFSAIAAIESSVWKEGLAGSSVDLSEWQLTYFNYHTAVDPLGLTDGDTVYTTDYLKQGGNQYMATAALANWKGVVSEGLAPYSTVKTNANSVLSSALAYDNDRFHLENAYWIPRADITEVKQAILNYGAVVCNYYQNSYFFNSESNAYYCPSPYTYNHGIIIVGWNDDFDHAKFGNAKPGMSGAWLCKNSWGTGWGDDGFFWISYADGSLDNNVYAYDFANSDNYTYNYQYDGTSAMLNGTESTNTVYTANVYTATGRQMLEAVGYYTYDTLYNTTVMVYKNPSNLKNPASGLLVSSQTVTDTYAGFHTLQLDSDVLVTKGDVFSIVVRQTAPSGKAAHYYVDHDYNSAGLEMISYAEEGQSFVSTNGSTWEDIGAADQANLRIKAYANPTSMTAEEWNTVHFITRLYETCLNRAPDEEGMDHWMGLLLLKKCTGAEVARRFVFSQEYLNKNVSNREYVTMLYYVFLNRAPDATGLAHWMELLNQGVSREYIFRGFAQSAEFTNLCEAYGIDRGVATVTQARDMNAGLTLFVNRLYVQALGRSGEVDGLNHWCSVILTGQKTPEQVAESFIMSEEFRNKNLSDREYIQTLYRTFLGREYDTMGYYHWIGELSSGSTREDIMHRFAASEEFQQIKSAFGL